MSFLQKIFSDSNGASSVPNVRFGRYTDVYHTERQDEAFDKAVINYENGNFTDAYVSFFNYLKNEKEDNVKVWQDGGTVHFVLYQGSRMITGHGDVQKLQAQARIARASKLETGFMKRMLEENYELRYSRFVLTPENEIAIIFESYTLDGSPYKLYAALKELATYADKHDDLLVDEFEGLLPLDPEIKKDIPEGEKKIKYDYIVREIRAVFEEIDNGKLNAVQYPSGISYLLLYLCCKLDYLTRPEGYMMETLERIHRLAFSNDGKGVVEKNEMLREEFQRLLDRPREKFFQEMYLVRSTFGITAPIDHRKVALIIQQELPNMKWYKSHGYTKIALSIPGFIASRCLFYFAVPEPDQALFHLLLQVLESDYFEALGFPSFLKKGQLKEKRIKKQIQRITSEFRHEYPKLNPNLRLLQFDSLPDFAESYCRMMQEMELVN